MALKVTISLANSKLGRIPNISLTPIVSCRPGVPCAKDCYALKSYRQYPNVRKAWDGNLEAYLASPTFYFDEIAKFLLKKKPRFFRVHVGGDIPDVSYWKGLKALCQNFPDTKFLLFTKFHELNLQSTPDNISVILSVWPGMELPIGLNLHRSFAWMQDGTETRVPFSALECPGNCSNCGACWGLGKKGIDVVFHKH